MFVNFAAGINFVPLAVFWPLQANSVYNSGHVELGIRTIPAGLCILSGAIISAVLCGRWQQHVRWIMLAFCIVQTVGVGTMNAADPHDINTVYPSLIFGLLGVGGVLFPNQIIATAITPDDLIATVTALTFVLRAVAQSVALAIFQNRFAARLLKNAFKYVAIPAIQAGLNVTQITSLVTTLTAVPFKEYVPQHLPQLNGTNYDILREATLQAYAHSYPIIYWVCLAFGIAACIASVLVGDVSQYIDEHVAVTM